MNFAEIPKETYNPKYYTTENKEAPRTEGTNTNTKEESAKRYSAVPLTEGESLYLGGNRVIRIKKITKGTVEFRRKYTIFEKSNENIKTGTDRSMNFTQVQGLDEFLDSD